VTPLKGCGTQRDSPFIQKSITSGCLENEARTRGTTINMRNSLSVGKLGIPLIFRIQTVSLKVLDLKFKVLDEMN
jgi:hypothetical protein